MRYHRLAPLVALTAATLALAGCEKKAETPAAPVSEEAAATAVPPTDATPTVAASDVGAVPTSIPAAIQGRWGMVPLDCTGDPAAAKGLIAIDATTIKFYEARARLGKIKSGNANAIDATYAFTGEGQEWTLDLDLKLEDGGKTLIRKDTGKDAEAFSGGGPLKYTRC